MVTFTLNVSTGEILDAGKAEAALAPLVSSSEQDPKDVTRAVLSGCTFLPEASSVVARVLAEIGGPGGSLREIVLADISQSLTDNQAAESLGAFGRVLETLDVSLRLLDLSQNPGVGKEIEIFSKVFAKYSETIEEIGLRECGLDNRAVEVLVSALLRDSERLSSLSILRLDGNLLDGNGIKALVPLLEASPSIRDLSIGRLGGDSDAARSVCRALNSASSLISVDVSGLNFSSEESRNALCDLLESQADLKVLRLEGCGLGDEGCRALGSRIVKSCCKLEELELADNNMSDVAQQIFRRTMEPLTQLQLELGGLESQIPPRKRASSNPSDTSEPGPSSTADRPKRQGNRETALQIAEIRSRIRSMRKEMDSLKSSVSGTGSSKARTCSQLIGALESSATGATGRQEQTADQGSSRCLSTDTSAGPGSAEKRLPPFIRRLLSRLRREDKRLANSERSDAARMGLAAQRRNELSTVVGGQESRSFRRPLVASLLFGTRSASDIGKFVVGRALGVVFVLCLFTGIVRKLEEGREIEFAF